MSEQTKKLLRTVDAWERLIRQLPKHDWPAEIAAVEPELVKTETPVFAQTVKWALEQRLLRG